MKKDIYIGEDKHNNHFNNNNDYKFKKLKKNQSVLNYFKDNLGLDNDIIDLKRNNNINKGSSKNNNILFLNNPITPQVQNINININFNNNLKKNSNIDNDFNKSEINVSENLFNDLCNNENNNHNHYVKYNNNNNNNQTQTQTQANNYYLFKKNNIKKEILLSYDKNMDDMMKSHRNSMIEEKKLKNAKENKNFTRFQKPKKLESIFTEEDIKMEELNDISETEIEKVNNNNIQKKNISSNINNIKTYHNTIHHEQEYSFNANNNLNINNNNKDYQHRKLNRNRSVGNFIGINNKNNKNNIKEINHINPEKNLKIINTKEISKTEEKKTDCENDNDNNTDKKKRRNRVKSLDDKIRKNDSGCCIIY
jgi:hypothetical protein